MEEDAPGDPSDDAVLTMIREAVLLARKRRDIDRELVNAIAVAFARAIIGVQPMTEPLPAGMENALRVRYANTFD